MNNLRFSILFNILVVSFAKEYTNKLDRYLIACHSTDFTCFKRQYLSLRDHVLLGSHALAISNYEPFVFRYGDTGTCTKISGVEESQLVAISLDSSTKEYSMVLEMPIKIQQILNTTATCVKPDKAFTSMGTYNGALRKFSGNATVTLSYPYKLRKQKGKIHMYLDEENMDVILDIPDLSLYDRKSELESRLFEWSEWAYDMVQHVDVAEHCLAPYTGQIRNLMDRVPLDKLMLLYPEEEYTELQFSFASSEDE